LVLFTKIATSTQSLLTGEKGRRQGGKKKKNIEDEEKREDA